MSNRILGQKLLVVAEKWTVDPFRPHLQLGTFLKSLAAHPRLTPEAVQATRALKDNVMQKKVWLGRLLKFRGMLTCLLQYKLSDKMLKPASSPQHYERLVMAFEKSAQGIGRPWWKIFFGIH